MDSTYGILLLMYITLGLWILLSPSKDALFDGLLGVAGVALAPVIMRTKRRR